MARTGVLTGPAATNPARAWTSDSLDGDVYAEPLTFDGRVIVATENDTVVSLERQTGRVQWQAHLGDPVPRSDLPCGNIDPTGITGTPVIDPQTGLIYVVAFLRPAHHEVYAIEAATGAIRFHRAADGNGADPRVHQQRAALTLAGGTLYVTYGGLYGDCGDYHGRVVGVKADGSGDPIEYTVPVSREGAIWGTPGPVIGSAGNLYVATGNGEDAAEFDHSNSVVKLGPDLKELDVWAPANWRQLSAGDIDLGSLSPAIVDNQRVFIAGKEGKGYLLDQARLGGVGGEMFAGPVCDGAYGGTAYARPLLFVPCTDGLVALDVGAASFTTKWKADGVNGSPIVAGGLVWAVNTSAGDIFAFDPANGAERFRDHPGRTAHFVTPGAGAGAVYIAADRTVVAYSLTGGRAANPA